MDNAVLRGGDVRKRVIPGPFDLQNMTNRHRRHQFSALHMLVMDYTPNHRPTGRFVRKTRYRGSAHPQQG